MGAIEYWAQCHCGGLSARYCTRLPPSAWSMRACQCSFCRRHAALTTSDPAGLIEYQCEDPQLLQRYRFGTRSTDFLICRSCGVYLGAQMTSDGGKRFGILNVRTLMVVAPGLQRAELMDYERETPEGRLRRREARWTPVASHSM